MNKRTFDIIARFISEELGIKVVYGDVPGPCITLEDKTIRLPEKIKEQNALAALSSLMHEAAHMKYTTIIPKDFSKTNIDHNIMNAIEDVRIDRKNFRLLPNIYEFYKKFIDDHVCSKEYKEKLLSNHLFTRCLIFCILECEGFGQRWDKEATEKCNNDGLLQLFEIGSASIDMKDWKKLREVIDMIKSKFPDIKKEEKPQQGGSSGECKPSKEGKSETSQGESGGNSKDDGKGSGDKAGDCKNSSDPSGQKPIGNASELIRPSSVWGKGDGLKGPGGTEFNPLELQEITKRRFKDALNITEKIIIDDGQALNTDNLMSYFTGEPEELFIEDAEIKTKNSKIVFCLDSSGSMTSALMDKKSRRNALISSVDSLIKILDEVKETESLNVDYEIIAFDDFTYPLNKNTWIKEYNCHGGGTNFTRGIEAALRSLSDPCIDGNKIMIIVTDGCVSSGTIENAKQLIANKDGSVKAMILGIGARNDKAELMNGNILFEEHAEQILMEAIQEALEV